MEEDGYLTVQNPFGTQPLRIWEFLSGPLLRYHPSPIVNKSPSGDMISQSREYIQSGIIPI